ncbi:MAG: ammonia-forming cytochrome c nitrite reductase subunit c552, partial [Lachnospiraceae bacterium]|nr:ammonia-forming cytochrome c nitrite reductase subunit c552 [Lachnospiraceae bacterium]
MKNTQLFEALGAAALGAVMFLGLGAAGGNRALYYTAPSLAANNPVTAEDIVYQQVDAPATKSADGVITAEEWSAVYPDIAVSMGANSENSYHVSYLEEDPYLVNIYEGYGFAKDYESARGHAYTLEDVAATARPHATANCLTCKTPNFTKLVNDQGVDVYSMDFNEVYEKMTETVSCYTCHENMAGNEGQLVVTHSYVHKALGENVSTIKDATLV